MKQLKVYRSSAGSGKTFNLVKHYLSILLQAESPYVFKEVLAITFTNKAAQEMKDRILDELQIMIYDIDSSDMLKLIAKEISISEQSLMLKCKSIYSKIIHNYSDFNVMTIDRFTNSIINAFSKELNLLPSYEIILDEKEFLSEAVSLFVDESSEDEKFLKLVFNIIDDAISQGLNTDIEKQLNQLEKILVQHQQKIKHYDQFFLQNIRTHLFNKIKGVKADIISHLDKINQLVIQNQVLESWSPYGRLSKILKLKDQIVDIDIEFVIQFSDWIEENKLFKKSLSNSDQIVSNAFQNLAKPVFLKLINKLKTYIKTRELSKLFVPFLMVNSLYYKLRELKKEQNVIFISDFNTLISDIIQNEPAGFIFERIGSRFNHVLVDEFQDTSILQWHNLVPLIHESISNGGANLIVGDAKQAIYRWRDGDVQQFMDLPQLPSLENRLEYESLFKYGFDLGYLGTNWRSTSSIINFNNTLFGEVSQQFDSNYIKEVFFKSKQYVHRKDIGSVDVNLNEISLVDYLDENIKKITELGYQYSDITILVRTSKDGLEMANLLHRLNLPYISEDSIYLFNSVQFKLLYFCLRYFETRNNDDFNLFHHYLSNFKNEKKNNQKSFLSSQFDQYLNLKDINKLDFIFSILNLSKSDAFIDCFYDQFYHYIIAKKHSIYGFLELIWNESKKISVDNSNSNAIQILTIHKSKGLEFPVVILPKGIWSTQANMNQPFIWVDGIQIDETEFDYFIAKMNRKVLTSIDKKVIYDNEEQLNILDDLNLYYVAFTRAVDHLFVNFSGKVKNGDVSDLLIKCIKNHQSYNEKDLRLFEGNLEKYDRKIKKPFKKTISISECTLFRFKENYKLTTDKKPNFGSVFHQIISKVYSNFNDGFNFATELKELGKITQEEYEKSLSYLDKLSESNRFSFVFEDHPIIYNEKEIVNNKGEILRLDRIFFDQEFWWIIDYKTAKKVSSDIKQVESYVHDLNEMGYKKVKGLIIYLPSLEVIHV